MTPVDSILARLLALHPKRIDLSLERMRRVLERLGSPEKRVPPVIPALKTAHANACELYDRLELNTEDPEEVAPSGRSQG